LKAWQLKLFALHQDLAEADSSTSSVRINLGAQDFQDQNIDLQAKELLIKNWY